jgi:DNA-directed RNA polymerase subunit M/transcription elongation factor TFIIS
MHFCNVCQNMYYISINEDDSNKLTYYCRHCGNVDDTLMVDSVSISKTFVKSGEQKFSHIINQYTKLDPTLPRINKILCPNVSCETNTKNEPREIIYIRYDNTQMSYVYLCSTCDTTWKNK